MSQNSSASWRHALKGAKWGRRCALGGIATALAVIASQWIAGYFLLWSFHLPRLADPLTVARYAYYYGTNPVIRRRVLICSGLGFVLVAASALVFALPKSRSLHGDAKFATTAEISRAGLFSKQGMILGKIGSRYLILPGQQSVILAAPPPEWKGCRNCSAECPALAGFHGDRRYQA